MTININNTTPLTINEQKNKFNKEFTHQAVETA